MSYLKKKKSKAGIELVNSEILIQRTTSSMKDILLYLKEKN